MSVLLPAPFSPRSACTSPRRTSRETSSFATTPGKRFVMCSMRSTSEFCAVYATAARPSGVVIGAPPSRRLVRRGLLRLLERVHLTRLQRVVGRFDLFADVRRHVVGERC